MVDRWSEQLTLGLPAAQGLYDPAMEKDGCGVGFVCHIKGKASHDIITDALAMNCCMEHRGGVGYEANTGDGAGIITGIPYEFLERVAKADLGVELPARGRYGAGIVFLPRDLTERNHCKKVFEAQIAAAGQQCLGWRVLPIEPDLANIGNAARRAMPHIEQLFIGASAECSAEAFERKLYVIRKHSTHLCRGDNALRERQLFYVSSLSSKTIVYKGMLTPDQLGVFFSDLRADDYASHMAMIHSRFSTNTFPSWDRAQPNRFMSHNGEINTLLGNKNSMNSRQGVVASALYGSDLQKLFPVFADLVQRPRFDPVRFEVVMGRLLENIQRREDRPDGVAARATDKAVFGPTSPLGREATQSTVKGLTVADVKKVHASWGAKTSRLVITGDYDPKVLRALIDQEFGSWKGGSPPPRAWPAPMPLQRRVILVPRKIAQAKVRLATWGFPRNSPQEFPLRLVNTTLGTFGVGRLYAEIRDVRGLA